jgi:ParB family chromosome partitioning protein
VNKPRQSIANILRLLQLEPAIQEMIASNQLTEGHAKSLLSANKLQQLSLAKECFMHKWSVRKLETEIVKLKNIKSAHPQRKSEDPDTHFLERRLSEYLGSPVSIGKGKLEIEFLSTECLEGIFNKMGFKLEDD